MPCVLSSTVLQVYISSTPSFCCLLMFLQKGDTPLQKALKYNHLNVALTLLQKGESASGHAVSPSRTHGNKSSLNAHTTMNGRRISSPDELYGLQ